MTSWQVVQLVISSSVVTALVSGLVSRFLAREGDKRKLRSEALRELLGLQREVLNEFMRLLMKWSAAPPTPSRTQEHTARIWENKIDVLALHPKVDVAFGDEEFASQVSCLLGELPTLREGSMEHAFDSIRLGAMLGDEMGLSIRATLSELHMLPARAAVPQISKEERKERTQQSLITEMALSFEERPEIVAPVMNDLFQKLGDEDSIRAAKRHPSGRTRRFFRSAQ